MRFWRRYRTIILAVLATAMLAGSAIYNFGVDWREMLAIFAYCLLFVLTMMLLAALTVGLFKLCRRLLQR